VRRFAILGAQHAASAFVLAVLLLSPFTADAQDWSKYEAEAVERLQQYFRIDTSNPPGNEKRAADWFCELLTREHIECRVIEYAPGRANAIARLKGDGSKRPIVLLNHTDVVQAEAKQWSVPPFSGEVRDGVLYGRGAQDMKSEGMLQLMVMLALAREKVPLARDVIFLAVADEEVDSTGSKWMLAEGKNLIEDAEFLINEGGENLLERGEVPFWSVSVGEKIPFWLRLVAHGKAGHGSVPMHDAATHRLARALARVVDYETPLTILPIVQRILCDEAKVRAPREQAHFCHLEASVRDPAFRKRITGNPIWNTLVRNTISLTVMQGGPQTNVIPAEAIAHLDVRLLPGEDPQKFLAEIRRVIGDDQIEVQVLSPARVPNSSPASGELWQAFEAAAKKYYPKTLVTPRLSSGYTESQMYRTLGIASYGFCPFVSTEAESRTPHGNDERIILDEYKQGLRILWDVVTRVARKP